MVVRILAAGAFFFAVGGFIPSAPADWYISGAQFKCDAVEGSFEILPYTQSSEGDDPIQPGFKVVAGGYSLHRCKLGKRRLLAQFNNIVPGKAIGACTGGGVIQIPSLSVNGVELEEDFIIFDLACVGSMDTAIERIKVEAAPTGAAITTCTVTYGDGRQGQINPCETRTLDVDRIAAEQAKIDNDLADAATQKAQAATALPEYNDLAKLFPARANASGLPRCAHVLSYEGWNLPDGTPRFGRIAGAKGDRVYISRRHPQLCTSKGDDGCNATAYVLAGDRVSVGSICGPWSYIQYTPRVRAIPPTQGWVKTAQLYGIPSLPAPTRPRSAEDGTDPLTRAAFNGDAAWVEALLVGGADPNGADKISIPLYWAAWYGDVAVVKLLLAHGADPGKIDPDPRSKRRRPLLTGLGARNPAEIAKLLIGAGASIDGRGAGDDTPLRRAVDANDVDVAAVLFDAGADPNLPVYDENPQYSAEDGFTLLHRALRAYADRADPTIIRLLLEHGADPNFRDGDNYFGDGRSEYGGETALTIAARQGYLSVVRLLLEHGADTMLPRADGAFPADIARQSGFPAIAKLIDQVRKSRGG
jgi:ankyrin repeat protein